MHTTLKHTNLILHFTFPSPFVLDSWYCGSVHACQWNIAIPNLSPSHHSLLISLTFSIPLHKIVHSRPRTYNLVASIISQLGSGLQVLVNQRRMNRFLPLFPSHQQGGEFHSIKCFIRVDTLSNISERDSKHTAIYNNIL